MKNFLLISSIAVASCCGSKNATVPATTSTDVQTEVTIENDPGIPLCIKKLVVTYKAEKKQNPPRSIYSYLYNGKTVYYVPAICCDFFSDLYDANCNIIGHPDGGYTGKGDGTAADFSKTRTAEKLIWQDDRK
ncbi:MAG: hypothetical protein JWQ27_2454 [Ferruginibacter sp.]|nr:hypothetical protein [Ferruginibacter sp.]